MKITSEHVEEWFCNYFTTSEQIEMYNEYCTANNSPEDCIKEFDEDFFNENFSSPRDAVYAWIGGDDKNNLSHQYIKFDAYGNLKTIEKLDVMDYIYVSDMEDWLIESYEDKIREDLEIEDDEEEDDE